MLAPKSFQLGLHLFLLASHRISAQPHTLLPTGACGLRTAAPTALTAAQAVSLRMGQLAFNIGLHKHTQPHQTTKQQL